MNVKTLKEFYQNGDTYTPEWSFKHGKWIIQAHLAGRKSGVAITTARGQVKTYSGVETCIAEIEGITGQKVVELKLTLETIEPQEQQQ